MSVALLLIPWAVLSIVGTVIHARAFGEARRDQGEVGSLAERMARDSTALRMLLDSQSRNAFARLMVDVVSTAVGALAMVQLFSDGIHVLRWVLPPALALTSLIRISITVYEQRVRHHIARALALP